MLLKSEDSNLPPITVLATPSPENEDVTRVGGHSVAETMHEMDCQILQASAQVFSSGKGMGRIEERHRIREMYPHLKKPVGMARLWRIMFPEKRRGVQVP